MIRWTDLLMEIISKYFSVLPISVQLKKTTIIFVTTTNVHSLPAHNPFSNHEMITIKAYYTFLKFESRPAKM